MCVTAFFLFSVGYLNMTTLGLVSRQHAKPKRSIRIWRAGDDASTLLVYTGDIAGPDNSETKALRYSLAPDILPNGAQSPGFPMHPYYSIDTSLCSTFG